MSIKNAIVGSMIGVGFTSLGCTTILTLLKRYNRDKENEEGETLTLSRRAVPVLFEQFSNVLIVTSGLLGFYYGYKRKSNIKLLKN